MKKWLRRIGLGLLGLIVLAVAAGVIGEQVARWRAPRNFPPPGRMVDIGGRRLQIDCRGSGSPTVVFEANDLGGSTGWAAVQGRVAATTRACSYSRSGVMWSDSAGGRRDARALAADLHAVLAKAGEHAPFVLVGHSLGGLYAVSYAMHYRDEVAGIVMVDPAHPDQARRIDAITHRGFSALNPVARMLARLSWTGIPRLLMGTDAARPAASAFAPLSLVTLAAELDTINDTFADVAASHDFGAHPLYILTAMAPASPDALHETGMSVAQDRQFRPVWKQMHDEEATWSSASQHLLVPDSGHQIHLEKPELVVHAIESVVAAVRSGAPPRP